MSWSCRGGWFRGPVPPAQAAVNTSLLHHPVPQMPRAVSGPKSPGGGPGGPSHGPRQPAGDNYLWLHGQVPCKALTSCDVTRCHDSQHEQRYKLINDTFEPEPWWVAFGCRRFFAGTWLCEAPADAAPEQAMLEGQVCHASRRLSRMSTAVDPRPIV